MLLALSVGVQIWAGADGDKEFTLYVAGQILSGKQMYLQMFEPSPPLIFWLLCIPVSIGQVTGIMEGYVLSLLTLLLCYASIRLCLAVLQKHPEFAGQCNRNGFVFFLLAFLLVVWVNPAHFGDREHLIMVLIVPYILSKLPGVAMPLPRAQALAVGLMAGIGFCIKPQAAIIFIVIQLLVLWRTRSLRAVLVTETLLAGVIGLSYLLLVVALTPEYFTLIIPIALKTYAATNRGIDIIFSISGSVFMLAVTLCDFRPRYTSPYRRDIYYFFGVGLACVLYIVTNNGWGYTFIPLNTLILLLTGWVYFEYRWLIAQPGYTPQQSRQFLFGSRACMLNIIANTVLVIATYAVVFSSIPAVGDGKNIREELVRELTERKVKRFGMMSMNFSLWPSVARVSHAEQVTRFSNLWMMNAFLRYDDAFRQRNIWVLEYVASAYADDLTRYTPDAVFIETTQKAHAEGKGSALLAQLLPIPAFSTAWQGYAAAGLIDICDKDKQGQGDCLYEVYTRKNTVASGRQ